MDVMKTKIEIKSIFGEVLFEYEKENNKIKDTLEEAVKTGADLRGADLREADLRGADLRVADLYVADLRGADLREANLRVANLYRVDLREANLYGADLREANLYGANLRGADLGDWGKIRELSDILVVGNIGSRNGYTSIFRTDKGVFVMCGCFKGTICEFEKKVKETHQGNNHERDYLAMIEFAKVKFGITE